ncbi:MAG: hypothetical protein QM528_01050 [Phycisphaerales bacterium]|nr:hypothetical protein [Phycisphaerales bacterium]
MWQNEGGNITYFIPNIGSMTKRVGVTYLNFILITIEHIAGMPSEERPCKTKRMKCPSKMDGDEYIKRKRMVSI